MNARCDAIGFGSMQGRKNELIRPVSIARVCSSLSVGQLEAGLGVKVIIVDEAPGGVYRWI
jgi:hypothetical protein